MRIFVMGMGLCLSMNSVFANMANQSRMVYGETAKLDHFDPYTVHEAAGHRLANLLFDSLVEVGPGGEYQPSLAQSWDIHPNGTSVTFQLRRDVHWHAGQKGSSQVLRPKDIMTTIRILTNSASEIPNSDRFKILSHAEKVAGNKVTIHLQRASVDPLRYMMFKVLPSHILDGDKPLTRQGAFTRNPIGTGPYYFVQANSQGEVLLKANAGYHKGKPQIDDIVLKAYSDQNVMAQSLMYKSLDLVTYVSPRDLDEIVGDKQLGVVSYDALSFSFIAFNTQKPFLKDKRVRQALSYATNRKEMLDAFFNGRGQVISGPFPPTSWAYNLDVKPPSFDLPRAKALLSDAGYQQVGNQLKGPDGKPVTLTFAVPLGGESELIKRIVLAYQGYLTKVGVTLKLKFMDWAVWKEKVLKDHDYDLTLASWSFDDASNITSLFHSAHSRPWGNNFVQYRNPDVDALLTEVEVSNDFDKRRAISHKLHAILAEEAPYTYLWTLQHHAAHNTRLSGVKVEPFSFFKYITLWNLAQK